MIVLKSFVVDQTYMLKKRSDDKQILSNNESKALINNLIDQIEFLKNELRSKDTIIKLIIENSKYNNEYLQNKNNNDSNQTEKFATPKTTAKLKTSDNKDLNNFASLHRFKILEDKEIDYKENQNNEHENSTSHSACQPYNSDRVHSKVIVKKSTSSKPKVPVTVILGDSIRKNVYGNIITKSAKHKKTMLLNTFLGQKLQI